MQLSLPRKDHGPIVPWSVLGHSLGGEKQTVHDHYHNCLKLPKEVGQSAGDSILCPGQPSVMISYLAGSFEENRHSKADDIRLQIADKRPHLPRRRIQNLLAARSSKATIESPFHFSKYWESAPEICHFTGGVNVIKYPLGR
jgi:hypothetical protein